MTPSISHTLIDMMDDEDIYGIPSDYYSYSEATPRHYSETVPTSSFDERHELLDETLADKSFDDFGECMRLTWGQFSFILC